MNQYALYLRKSRADLDAEARGEGETLAKHRAALRAMAERRGLFILKEYAEVVSGDTIAARPKMQQLLEDVKSGMYAGVIVNDVDRLGRGDSIDQEIIKMTFAASNTLIITPNRDIDPANPSDQDMLDFSMFFARFEYRKISQRMTVGRYRSAASGNYLASHSPFGYVRTIIDGRPTLVPHPEQAPIVRMIFEWYASRKYGYKMIVQKLNEMGIRSNSNAGNFSEASIKTILVNPVYIGQVIYGRRKQIKYIENGVRHKVQRQQEPSSIVDNAHKSIVPRDLFAAVQDIIADHRHATPVRASNVIVNPLAGLLRCAACGYAMVQSNYKEYGIYVKCKHPGCKAKSARRNLVEEAIINMLHDYVADYKPVVQQADDGPQRELLQKQVETLTSRLSRARELLELGIYTIPEYLDQKKEIETKLTSIQAEISAIEQPAPTPVPTSVIKKTLDAYALASTPAEKNALLKSVVDHVDYSKLTKSEPFVLTLFPRFGQHI